MSSASASAGRTVPRRAFVRPCPYGKPGDRLWVRENCWAHKDTGEIFGYCAEDETLYDDNKTVKKVPSIHMPRSKCRLMLEIIAVRIERLHDISAADAIAEGIRPAANPRPSTATRQTRASASATCGNP